ncbi:MAG: YkgJ family cysteine cluster protein [Candidatus Sericytochromatia bacterium]|nr:YkgJ family cysteine cluster protein [Candidatus Sericytochromatia bacterium]
MSDPGPASPSVEAVEARLLEIFYALPATTGFGTAAPQDLTVLVDEAIATVEAALPPFRCRSGCFQCCEEGVPLVSALEWRRLHAFLATQSEDFVLAIVAPTMIRYRRQVDGLTYAAMKLRGDPPAIEGVESIDMDACPMLIDGKCGVYEARPLLCRSYGFMTVQDEADSRPLMCQPAVEQIKETFPAEYALPRFEPFEARLRQLNGSQGRAHLPLWIMAQHELGGYLAPPITDPLPWALRRVSRLGFV